MTATVRLAVEWTEALEVGYEYAVAHQPGAMVSGIEHVAPDEPMVAEVHTDFVPEVLVQFFKTEDPGRRLVASLVVDVRQDRQLEDVVAFDSSVRVGDDRYKVLGRANVTVSGAPTWDHENQSLIGTMDTLFCKAEAVRTAFREKWQQTFSPLVSDKRITDFCLMRYTTERTLPEDCGPRPSKKDEVRAAQTTADVFIDRAHFLLDVSDQALSYVYGHCCKIYGTTVDEMEEWLVRQPTDLELYRACQVMGLMLLSGALATKYAGDKAAGGDEVERFSGACFSREGLGDCEDVGFAVFAAFHWIRKADFFPGLKRLLNCYECAMCTGAASNAKQDRNATSDKDAPYICHVWAMLVPRATLKIWDTEKSFAKLYPPTRDPPFTRLRVMIMEGTAPAPVFGLPPSFYVREDGDRALLQRERADAAEVSRRVSAAVPELKDTVEVPFKPTAGMPQSAADFSDFYRLGITFWLHNPGGPRVGHLRHKGKYGVGMHLVMRGDDSVQLVAHDTTVPFTDLQRRALAAYSAPVMPLVGEKEIDAEIDGAIDGVMRGIFYLQAPIAGLAQRLRGVKGYCGSRQQNIRLAPGVVLTVVEVWCDQD